MKASLHGLAIAVAVISAAATAYAGITPNVPEIGAGEVTTALGVVAAGILVLRARRGK